MGHAGEASGSGFADEEEPGNRIETLPQDIAVRILAHCSYERIERMVEAYPSLAIVVKERAREICRISGRRVPEVIEKYAKEHKKVIDWDSILRFDPFGCSNLRRFASDYTPLEDDCTLLAFCRHYTYERLDLTEIGIPPWVLRRFMLTVVLEQQSHAKMKEAEQLEATSDSGMSRAGRSEEDEAEDEPRSWPGLSYNSYGGLKMTRDIWSSRETDDGRGLVSINFVKTADNPERFFSHIIDDEFRFVFLMYETEAEEIAADYVLRIAPEIV